MCWVKKYQSSHGSLWEFVYIIHIYVVVWSYLGSWMKQNLCDLSWTMKSSGWWINSDPDFLAYYEIILKSYPLSMKQRLLLSEPSVLLAHLFCASRISCCLWPFQVSTQLEVKMEFGALFSRCQRFGGQNKSTYYYISPGAPFCYILWNLSLISVWGAPK